VCRMVNQGNIQRRYRRANIRKIIIYFLSLVSIQVLAIASVVLFNIKENIFLLFILGIFIATILPILLAIIIFGWRPGS